MSEERIDEISELFEIVESDDHVADVPLPKEVLESAEQVISASEEVIEQAKQELEQLESPLIVHKVTDASYQETASDVSMDETHATDDGPTLVRHRFRKEKKKGGKAWKFVLLIIVVAVAVLAGLYYSGVINPNKQEQTTKAKVETTVETTTSIEQAFQGKIVLKGTYIFVDGVEVDGIEGLQKALKYEDPSPTTYEIVKENADANFLNNEVIPVMMKMGFYDENTVISTIVNTGLVAQEELTTVQIKDNKKKNKSKKQKKNNQVKNENNEE